MHIYWLNVSPYIYIERVPSYIGVIYVPFYVFKHQQSICGNIYMRGLYTYFSMFFCWAKVIKSVTQIDTNSTQNCHKIVTKLSQNCHKIVTKLTQIDTN